jgi:hypothetical protein
VQTTTNYGFKKPETNDPYNINDFNETFDVIDRELKAAANKADAVSAHLSDTGNPHNTTKAQVGLDNVPNVSTNDQTPTYTVPAANAALSSGEKLSVAFGKIARAVSSLISHLTNMSNPHKVTASQVGAVTQGGANSVTISWHGEAGIKAQVDSTDIGTLVSTGSVDSVVLPIHKGGTGASSASEALNMLGAVHANESNIYNFTNKTINSINIDNVFQYNYVVGISEAGHGTVPVNNAWLQVMNFYTSHFVTQLAFTCGDDVNPKRPVRMWIRERYKDESSAWSDWSMMHNENTIIASTTDLIAGTSELQTGAIYIVYE